MFLVVWIGFGFQMAPTRSPDSYQGRTELELDVEEATFSDVTLSPDGTTIVFTILGHLFRVPEMGGMAEQLTVGPSYNSDPVFSPDGSHLAFVSDRDGSDGNVRGATSPCSTVESCERGWTNAHQRHSLKKRGSFAQSSSCPTVGC
jgi:Tol biopolymer transport system component